MDEGNLNLLVNAVVTIASQFVGYLALRAELRKLRGEHEARLRALEGGRRKTDQHAWESS